VGARHPRTTTGRVNDNATWFGRALAAASLLLADRVGLQPAVRSVTAAGEPTWPLPAALSSDAAADDLTAHANAPGGLGEIHSGRVLRIGQRLIVYRLFWDQDPNHGYGHWWAIDPPQERDVEIYRSHYALSHDVKNIINRDMECTHPPGTIVVLGPGQSADCKAGPSYAQSPFLQVYLTDPDPRQEGSPLRSCKSASDFP
jgi:hypothetical protein